ncbi:unnamed protein product [Cylicocyclus nassatus]|uniref:HORMA domain-containing protein n=1 Tax=Cylicocyclus nassatus TaxID=53992 RepID=A0AA36DSF4_CYLNA|nr:unnamed protein product [Cylicocyclus nassatus]
MKTRRPFGICSLQVRNFPTMAPHETDVHQRVVKKWEWADTFPEDLSHPMDSTKFLTRCMYTAFCDIIANRRLLPKTVFKIRTIDEDLRVCVLNTSTPSGYRMVEKFRGVSHAIANRYLRSLMLVINPTREDVSDAVEMYTWHLRYGGGDDPRAEFTSTDGTIIASLKYGGIQSVKKQVYDLFKAIRRLCNLVLSPLPAAATATLRATYTNWTPEDYQAPGFYPSPENPILRPEAGEIRMGLLHTDHHTAFVMAKSIFVGESREHELLEGNRIGDSLSQDSANSVNDGDVQLHSTNNTMERISGDVSQEGLLEIPRRTLASPSHVKRIRLGSDSSNSSVASRTSRASVLEVRGSVDSPDRSEESELEETFHYDTPAKIPKKSRENFEEVASSSLRLDVIKTQSSCKTPPSVKTPGRIKCAKFTPKDTQQVKRG